MMQPQGAHFILHGLVNVTDVIVRYVSTLGTPFDLSRALFYASTFAAISALCGIELVRRPARSHVINHTETDHTLNPECEHYVSCIN